MKILEKKEHKTKIKREKKEREFDIDGLESKNGSMDTHTIHNIRYGQHGKEAIFQQQKKM